MFWKLGLTSIMLGMLSTTPAIAQETYDQDRLDEAYKRMQQRLAERQAATSQPTTQPATDTEAQSDEGDQPQPEKSYTLALQPNAPAEVQQWFDNLPDIREQYVGQVIMRTHDHIQRLERELDQAKRRKQQIAGRPVKKIAQRGELGGTTYQQDPADTIHRRNQINAATREIERLAKELRLAKEAAPAIIAEARNDRTSIIMPPLRLSVGAIGTIDGPVKVFQVVDDQNVMIHYHNLLLWLHGVSTITAVDDGWTTIIPALIITGIKSYTTVMGARKTVYSAEPMPDVRPYVYLAEYTPGNPSPVFNPPQPPAANQSSSLLPPGWQPQVNPTNPAATAPSQSPTPPAP